MAKVDSSRDRRSRRSGEKERQWRKIVAEQQRDGGTVRGFCREREINENSFYHWRRELRLRDRENDDATPNRPNRAGGRTRRLAPVVVIDEPTNATGKHSQTTIEIELQDGTTVRVMPGVTREQLETVFSVLEPSRC